MKPDLPLNQVRKQVRNRFMLFTPKMGEQRPDGTFFPSIWTLLRCGTEPGITYTKYNAENPPRNDYVQTSMMAASTKLLDLDSVTHEPVKETPKTITGYGEGRIKRQNVGGLCHHGKLWNGILFNDWMPGDRADTTALYPKRTDVECRAIAAVHAANGGNSKVQETSDCRGGHLLRYHLHYIQNTGEYKGPHHSMGVSGTMNLLENQNKRAYLKEVESDYNTKTGSNQPRKESTSAVLSHFSLSNGDPWRAQSMRDVSLQRSRRNNVLTAATCHYYGLDPRPTMVNFDTYCPEFEHRILAAIPDQRRPGYFDMESVVTIP